MTEPRKTSNPRTTVGGIAGAVGGYLVAQYTGPSLWIPGAAAILLLLLFVKTPLKPRHFLGAIAVTGGHVVWFILASIIIGNWSASGLDIVALAVGMAWLWARPGLGAALFLGLVQSVSLALNVMSLIAVDIGSSAHKALTVHCLFRLLALACLVAGYLRVRGEQLAPLPSPEV